MPNQNDTQVDVEFTYFHGHTSVLVPESVALRVIDDLLSGGLDLDTLKALKAELDTPASAEESQVESTQAAEHQNQVVSVYYYNGNTPLCRGNVLAKSPEGDLLVAAGYKPVLRPDSTVALVKSEDENLPGGWNWIRVVA